MAWTLASVSIPDDLIESLAKISAVVSNGERSLVRVWFLRPDEITEKRLDELAADACAKLDALDAARAVVSAKAAKCAAALPVQEVKDA